MTEYALADLVWFVVFVLIYLMFIVLPFWRIFSKAGYNGAWAIAMITPLLPWPCCISYCSTGPSKREKSGLDKELGTSRTATESARPSFEGRGSFDKLRMSVLW